MIIDKIYMIKINEQELNDIIEALHYMSSDTTIQTSDPEITKRLSDINMKMNCGR